MGPTAISFWRNNRDAGRAHKAERKGEGRYGSKFVVAAGLARCSPGVPFDDPSAGYTQRSLTISPATGNAQAANLAMQTSGPWPRSAQYTRISGNGSLMVTAVQNYENGTGGAPAPASGGGSSGAVIGAPSSPAPPPVAN